MKFSAILSTTIIPLDGVYKVETLQHTLQELNLEGVPHYVGHVPTKEIIEKFGAIPAPSKLFTGLEIGQQALCVPIAQGKSDRSQGGTTPHQQVRVEDLSLKILTRLE